MLHDQVFADEAIRMAAWVEAYRALVGVAPSFEDEADPPSRMVTFPAVNDPFGLEKKMVGTLRGYPTTPAILRHLRALGLRWDDELVIRTAPTPASLGRRLRALGFSETGLAPDLEEGVEESASGGVDAWLLDLCRGRIGVTVGDARFYAAKDSLNPEMPWLRLLLVQHDMTKHVVAAHLVPKVHLGELGSIVEQAFKAQESRMLESHAERLGEYLMPLTRFFENDLVGYCMRVWRAIEEPARFEGVFSHPPFLALLHRALDRRLADFKAEIGLRTPPAADFPPVFRR